MPRAGTMRVLVRNRFLLRPGAWRLVSQPYHSTKRPSPHPSYHALSRRRLDTRRGCVRERRNDDVVAASSSGSKINAVAQHGCGHATHSPLRSSVTGASLASRRTCATRLGASSAVALMQHIIANRLQIIQSLTFVKPRLGTCRPCDNPARRRASTARCNGAVPRRR